MARKQLLIKQSDSWLFGPRPTANQLVFPTMESFVFDLGDISKIPTVDIFDQFFTSPIEEAKKEGMDILRMISEPAFIWMAAKMLLDVTLTPLQAAIYSEIYNRPYPLLVASRGFAKSYGLGVILMLKAALTTPIIHGGPGMQAVVMGSGFRQSKIIFEYIERLWKQGHMLRSICGKGDGIHKEQDRFTIQINGNKLIFIPMGDGEKIRGLRATILVVDEINSTNTEILEKVAGGFTAVQSDPIGAVAYYKKAKYLRSIKDYDGLKELADTFTVRKNQIIYMGTAGHQFQPFYKYYNRYKLYIESQGNVDELKKHMPVEEIPDKFNYQDYSICQIPYSLIKDDAEGFMDEAAVARSKSLMDSATFDNEYEAVFTKDSAGFFKASVIHRNKEPYKVKEIGDQVGENYCLGHLFGIDVASEFDKFAVCVLGIYPNHAKVKCVWTTDRKSFEKRREMGKTKTSEYYSFCTRRVRELISCFPPLMSHPTGAYIGCDVGGGGVAIRESFKDLEKLRPGERPIYEITDSTEPKYSDTLEGDHCLYMVSFTKPEIFNDIYFGNSKLLEDGRIKFPEWDQVSIYEAAAADAERMEKFLESITEKDQELVLYDTLEDTYMEIYKTIDELCSIQATRTANNKITFKAKPVKNAEGRTVYMHKDRATALLIAMLLYKQYIQEIDPMDEMTIGGEIRKRKNRGGGMFENTSPAARRLNEQAYIIDAANRMLGHYGEGPGYNH